jgi:hypothetical protein
MKTYAENIDLASVMASGLKANAERAAKRGLGADFPDRIENKVGTVKTINNKQETIKADLKTTTEELDKEMDELNALVDEAKKVIKLEFPQSQWKEFGITDKR